MPRKVIDERCTCGHLKSEHIDFARPSIGTFKRAPHHGTCSKCSCKQFTWKSFIFDDGSEDIIPI